VNPTVSLCVFCGSSSGHGVRYREVAVATGQLLARNGIGLVYGGGGIGLMGILADAVLDAGGSVTGVIPEDLLARELGHAGLTRLDVVATMHERKARMAELSDGFIALPGGAGTLEEMFEQWTWVQLGIHDKPCGFLNLDGYFDPVRTMIAHMVHEGFLSQAHAEIPIFEPDAGALLDALHDHMPSRGSGGRQTRCRVRSIWPLSRS